MNLDAAEKHGHCFRRIMGHEMIDCLSANTGVYGPSCAYKAVIQLPRLTKIFVKDKHILIFCLPMTLKSSKLYQ